MATARDERFLALASRLLDTQKTVSYISVSISSTLDPLTLKPAKVSVISDMKARISSFDSASVDNKNILAQDLKLLVSAQVLVGSVKPNADKVLIDGLEYSVVQFKDTYADEEKVLRELQIRR